MPISIDFLANTSQFLRGAKDVEGAFEEVSDSLDDVVKDSAKAGDQLGDNVKDGAKQGETAVEKLERSFKDMADAGRRESKSAGDDIDRNVKRGTDGAEEGLKDFKDESASTARESAASFDGSAESIVDAFQEVAANAFAGFGPAGALAGLAAAAGIGVISASIADGGDDAEDLKQKISDLTSELIDAGTQGGPSLEYLIDQIKTLATETEDGKTNLKDLADVSKDAGSDFRTLAQAYAGNVDGLKELWREGDKRLTQLQEEADATDTTTSAGAKRYSTLINQSDAQQKYLGYLGQSLDTAKQAAEADALYAQAGGPELERKAALVDSIQSNIDDAAASWQDYSNKETGALDPAAYLAGIQARTDAATGYAANLAAAQAQLSPEAYQYLVDQGIDFAPMLQSILDSGLVPEMNNQFTQAVDAGNTALTGITPNIDVTVTTKADVKPATADIFKVKDDKTYQATINTKAATDPATTQIKSAAGESYSATIDVDANLGPARSQINSFLNEARNVTIVAKVVDRNGTPVL